MLTMPPNFDLFEGRGSPQRRPALTQYLTLMRRRHLYACENPEIGYRQILPCLSSPTLLQVRARFFECRPKRSQADSSLYILHWWTTADSRRRSWGRWRASLSAAKSLMSARSRCITRSWQTDYCDRLDYCHSTGCWSRIGPGYHGTRFAAPLYTYCAVLS